jgi:hypothetical protein
LLGSKLTARPSEADEYGEEVTVENVASGSTHDGCYFCLEPVSPQLKDALLRSVLELHSRYIGTEVDWSRVLPELHERLGTGKTLRLRSIARQQRLSVRSYFHGSGVLTRVLTRPLRIECAGGVGVVK